MSGTVPFDVAVAFKYLNVTDLTRRHLPEIYEEFLAGPSNETANHEGLFAALEKERVCGTPLWAMKSLSEEVGRLLIFKRIMAFSYYILQGCDAAWVYLLANHLRLCEVQN